VSVRQLQDSKAVSEDGDKNKLENEESEADKTGM
jgi:hypothetical protein